MFWKYPSVHDEREYAPRLAAGNCSSEDPRGYAPLVAGRGSMPRPRKGGGESDSSRLSTLAAFDDLGPEPCGFSRTSSPFGPPGLRTLLAYLARRSLQPSPILIDFQGRVDLPKIADRILSSQAPTPTSGDIRNSDHVLSAISGPLRKWTEPMECGIRI